MANFAGENPLVPRGIALRLMAGDLVKRPVRPKLLSSVDGKIEQVLLTIPSWILRYQRQPEIRPSALAIRSVLRQLPDHTAFLILTQEEGVSPLTAWLQELGLTHRTEVSPAPNKMRFGAWPQDGFVVCTDEESGQRHLVQPVSYRSVEDAYIPGMISARTGAVLTQAPLSFQGGNLLVGDDFWLLGMDSAVESVTLGLAEGPRDDAPRAGLEEAYSRQLDTDRKLHLLGSRLPVPGFEKGAFSKKVTVKGEVWDDVAYRGNSRGTVQPIFHIDAYVTLAGRDGEGRPTVLVGDPKLASEHLAREPLPQEMHPIFDDVADQLRTLGFRVVRNPLPLVHYDEPLTRRRDWYFATSNNVLVEVTGEGKRVWLPTYECEATPSLARTDQANRGIWEDLGFEVTQLADFHPFARDLGAAHCVTKCLARGRGPGPV